MFVCLPKSTNINMSACSFLKYMYIKTYQLRMRTPRQLLVGCVIYYVCTVQRFSTGTCAFSLQFLQDYRNT